MSIARYCFGRPLYTVGMQKRYLQYSSAVTRGISKSIKLNGLSLNPCTKNTFDFDLAESQHSEMINILQKIGLKVSKIRSDDHPDSVFIEDTAVVIKNHILITNPGALSRKPEVTKVQEFLSIKFPCHKLSVLQNGDLDGGDVLFTGSEIFVGVTARTNKEGVEALRDTFPEYPVTPVDLATLQEGLKEEEKLLHLKSFCSMAGDYRILVGGTVGGRFLEWLTARDKVNPENNSNSQAKAAKTAETPKPNKLQKYSVISLPDAAAANCVYANNIIIRRATKEFPASGAIFERSMLSDTMQIEIEYGELQKLDGALTCCSLLL